MSLQKLSVKLLSMKTRVAYLGAPRGNKNAAGKHGHGGSPHPLDILDKQKRILSDKEARALPWKPDAKVAARGTNMQMTGLHIHYKGKETHVVPVGEAVSSGVDPYALPGKLSPFKVKAHFRRTLMDADESGRY